MPTVMEASSREDTQQMLPEGEEVDPLMPTEMFFKEESMTIQLDNITPLRPLQEIPKSEPISIQENEITPLTPLQVFPKNEPIASDADEMTVLTPLQVFPKEELILSDENEMTPLAPLQVFPKQEPISDQVCEVVPLMPIQVFVKGEPIPYKAEEPVFASLSAVVPKEESEENVLSDAASEDSRSLVINLENSSDGSTGDNDPIIIEDNVHIYVSDYTDRSDNLVINVEDSTRSTETDPLRLSDESGQLTLDSGDSTSSDSPSLDSQGGGGHPFQCMLCRKSFCSAISLQMHKQSHTGSPEARKHIFDKLVPQLIAAPRTLKAKHECSNCGKTFAQLQMLMRHRLAHINSALHKPFSSIQASGAGTSSATQRATRASPAVPHKRRAKKRAANDQLATVSTRHRRTRIHRRRPS